MAAEAPRAFRHLSPSTPPKATFFDGGPDGKIGTPRHGVACFQMLASAGDY
jgi:hypothetical protein